MQPKENKSDGYHPDYTQYHQADRLHATTQHYDLYIAIGGDPEQHIGAAPTYALAEQRCQAYARDFLAGDLRYSATELDGTVSASQTITVIAHLPDGTPMRSVLDSDGTRLAVYAETPAWYICAGTDGSVFVELRAGGDTVDLDLTPRTHHPLRDLLNGDTIDRLLACAYAWAADHRPERVSG